MHETVYPQTSAWRYQYAPQSMSSSFYFELSWATNAQFQLFRQFIDLSKRLKVCITLILFGVLRYDFYHIHHMCVESVSYNRSVPRYRPSTDIKEQS